MSLQELLVELIEKGVQLSAQGDNLRIHAPKGILTQSDRHKLSEYKAEILRLLRQPSSAEKVIEPVSRSLPLSPSIEQERLWLVDKIVSRNGVYNLVQAIQLKGKLEISILEKSLNNILQRHEALQTTFTIQDGKVIQIINSFSCSLVLESSQASEINKIADGEAEQPFNLECNPLWRFRILQIAELEYVLIVTFHHAIGDILSTSIFIQEMATFYESLLDRKELPLPNLPIQYADFAFWQRQEIEQETIQKQSIYWQEQFQEIPEPLKLPYDRPQTNSSWVQGRHQTFRLPTDLWVQIKQFSQKQNITPATILLATFEMLLYLCSGQKDIVIGFPTSGRSHSQLESLIGFFAYPLPLRITLENSSSFQDVLKSVRDKLIETTANQNVPFSKIIENVKTASNSRLFQVLFSTFLGNKLNTIALPDLTIKLLPEASRTPTDLELLWSLYEVDEELHGAIGYNTNLFDSDTITELIQSYSDIIEQCLTMPNMAIDELRITDGLEAKKQKAAQSSQKPSLVVAASFTAEPITDILSFWLPTIDFTYQVEFAPYNQLFQQLLNPESLLRQNKDGINIILLRIEDWIRYEEVAHNYQQILKQSLQDFMIGLKELATQNPTPTIVFICPPSTQPKKLSEEELQNIENQLIFELNQLNGIYLVTTREINHLYPVKDYYDSQADELGHIPYTSSFFTALGTTIVRRIHALKKTIYKVIVLDCDRTLWCGVCGEDEIEDIKIDNYYQQLQQFIIEQKNQGMLLCLCSKNNLEDVQKVFDHHPDMLLKWEDFIDCQINWRDKSSNLKSLSEELQLGLESFIFIDDSPVECAEIQAKYPEVLTINLPDIDDLSQFLNHLWIFDKTKVTIEDRKRNTFYKENLQRQQVLNKSLTLADFIESLNLQVKINDMNDEQIFRISQLTLRTNQFNASTIRRTEQEIQSLLQLAYRCLGVEVKDRFGDYGLVGAIIFNEIEKILKVDTFLLSCRTLGRGVEYQMVAELGIIALEKRLDSVEFVYHPTPKNQPILNFLNQIGETYKDDYCFSLPAIYASQLAYQPDKVIPTPSKLESSSSQINNANSQLYNYIAIQLATISQISQAIATKFKKAQTTQSYVAPRNKIETCLSKIWSELLKVEPIGIHDNFFELGGDSILMIQVVARAIQAGLDITTLQVYEYQTIAQLATVANPTKLMETKQDETAAIVLDRALDVEDYKPSDFTDVDLSQEELDAILAALE